MSVEIVCQSAPNLTSLPTHQQIQTWINAAIGEHYPSSEIGIRFVAKVEMQSLNAQFRNKDKPTNVLSFPNPLPEPLKDDYLGDLVICSPVIEEEAATQNKSLIAHYAHMVVHGTLHLIGYDHQIDAEADKMEALEIAILDTLGFPNPYGAPTTYE